MANRNVSEPQFQGVQMPAAPKAHSAADNFVPRDAQPPNGRQTYREPVDGGGAAWQPSNVGLGRPVTPFSSSYFRPIVTA